jgi:hypothetical protein
MWEMRCHLTSDYVTFMGNMLPCNEQISFKLMENAVSFKEWLR